MDQTARAGTNLQGIALLACAFFFFSSGDTLAKFLTAHFHPIQIVWTRQIGLVLIACVLLLRHGPGLLAAAAPRLQVVRGALAVASAVCFVIGVSYVPLADAVAVTFIAPFLVTAMGALFLGETLTRGRWFAVLLGFVGVMIVIRPGLGVFHPAIGFVAVAAGFFALRQVLSRRLAARDSTQTTLCYTAFVSFLLLCLPLPFVGGWPQGWHLYALLGGMSLLASLGEFLVIRAFEMAEAGAAAPVHYSLIIWGTFYGWLVFDQLPDLWTWVGTAVILLAGIYVIRQTRA